jgi:hypothetical protein
MSSTAKAPRVSLGKRPESFTKTITGPMADGTIGAIDVTFRYRTRTEWGALLDSHAKAKAERDEATVSAFLAAVEKARAAGAEIPAAPGAEKRQAMEVEADARLVLDLATGWDLPDPFTLDSVKQLADEAPGIVTAIISGFREAVNEGRLGN